MKIKEVELTVEEQESIFTKTVQAFDKHFVLLFIRGGQEINFPLDEDIEFWAKLELYQDESERDGNNQSDIISQSVHKFKFWFMIDGEEIKVNDFNLDDRISNYYSL